MQTGAEHLVKIDKRLHCFFLPHDLFPQGFLEVTCCGTPLSRVQFFSVGRLRCCSHDASFVPGGTTLVCEWRSADHDFVHCRLLGPYAQIVEQTRSAKQPQMGSCTPNYFGGARSAHIKAGRNTSYE